MYIRYLDQRFEDKDNRQKKTKEREDNTHKEVLPIQNQVVLRSM